MWQELRWHCENKTGCNKCKHRTSHSIEQLTLTLTNTVTV